MFTLIPDPTRITDFEQSDNQLEMSLVFWILVAGKTAHVVVRQMKSLVQEFHPEGGVQESGESIFNVLAYHGLESIQEKLKSVGIGCWKLKSEALYQISRSKLDLRQCSIDSLEAIKGIGPKTARCFVLHSRSNARIAGLDTHILRFLRESGYPAPKTTPGSKSSYSRWEQLVLEFADQHKMSPSEFDLWVWNQQSRRSKETKVIAHA